MNLRKPTQDLYAKIYKTLMYKIKEHINKWRDTLCSWTGGLNTLKLSILPKPNYRFSVIPIQT